MNISISENLKELRNKKKNTQEDLANFLTEGKWCKIKGLRDMVLQIQTKT